MSKKTTITCDFCGREKGTSAENKISIPQAARIEHVVFTQPGKGPGGNDISLTTNVTITPLISDKWDICEPCILKTVTKHLIDLNLKK